MPTFQCLRIVLQSCVCKETAAAATNDSFLSFLLHDASIGLWLSKLQTGQPGQDHGGAIRARDLRQQLGLLITSGCSLGIVEVRLLMLQAGGGARSSCTRSILVLAAGMFSSVTFRIRPRYDLHQACNHQQHHKASGRQRTFQVTLPPNLISCPVHIRLRRQQYGFA